MRHIYLAFFFAICSFKAFSQVDDNPPVDQENCPYRIIFVVDESGSMSTGGKDDDLRMGSYNMVAAMVGSGGTLMAVVEFESSANRAYIGGTTAYRTVDATYAADFQYYVNCNQGGSSGWCPGGGTNWTDALNKVYTINANEGVADLVIFFTDGLPNYGGYVAAADAVQLQGSHIFVIGVIPCGGCEAELVNISGPDEYTPGANGNFLDFDYVVSSQFTTPTCR